MHQAAKKTEDGIAKKTPGFRDSFGGEVRTRPKFKFAFVPTFFLALSCGFVQIATGRLYIQGVQENQPKKMSRTKKPKLKWAFLFFEDAEILAGNQKISQRRKKPKMPPRKKRRWGVSIGRQGSIIFRAVSARSAWKLWWRMFISSIAYVLYVLMRAATNSKTKEHRRKKGGDRRNRHEKVPSSALIHAPQRWQKSNL